MDSLLAPVAPSSQSYSPNYLIQADLNADALVLNTTLGDSESDPISISFQDLYKGLSVTAKEIVDKLNEFLKDKLPDGIQSLKPEDVTPEATADRIVQGVTGLYDVFAKQHPGLEGEELLSKFLDTVRGGIDEGYNDAVNILENLGAFQFDGVKDGVEETKRLIEEKLKGFEAQKRKELGLDTEPAANDVKEQVSSAILTQAGGTTLSVVA